MDYFLIDEDLLSLCPDARIHSSYKSDHNVISLEINISKNEMGRGSWKLNSTLLENKELVKLIKKEINLIKQTYAIPVYVLDNLDKIDNSVLQLTISDSLFLDTLLCQVRGVIISFSKKLARENRELEKKLTLDKESIDRQIDQSPIDAEALKLELEEKKVSLEELRDKRMRGNQVIYREEFIKGWEKPSTLVVKTLIFVIYISSRQE